jgi:hypothetical protein
VTECVRRSALRNIDVAFVHEPPNGRMTPTAVADCLRTIGEIASYASIRVHRAAFRSWRSARGNATDTVRTLTEAVKNDAIEVRLGMPEPPGL